MERLSGRKSEARYENWLATLDQRVEKLPRAASWLNYSFFMLARYPHLRPRPSEDDGPKRRAHLEGAEEGFKVVIRDTRQRLASQGKLRRVLQGLNERQERELAALVADSIYEMAQELLYAATHRRLRQLAREAPRRGRILDRKIEKPRQAIGEVRQYAASLALEAGARPLRVASIRKPYFKSCRSVPTNLPLRSSKPQLVKRKVISDQ